VYWLIFFEIGGKDMVEKVNMREKGGRGGKGRKGERGKRG
jgi:hypothetical protein